MARQGARAGVDLNLVATRDLVGAAQWTTAAFTTYALSLSFFEAVVLDLLVRKQSASPLIVADVDGVRAALSEHGARRVGRDYDLEPVALTGGVFHPKITFLANSEDAHLVVGSGNLTFGGWAGNLECVEHLHPSFAADAFSDAEAFFLALALEPRLKHEALGKFEVLSERLGLAAASGPRHGRVRLLHSLGAPLGSQIADLASELGGARRIVIASPYWDKDAQAIASLCRAAGLEHAYAHVHPHGLVQAGVAENYPRSASLEIRAVEAEPLCEAAAKRPMHAKLMELICTRGRLLVSGSANATTKALGKSGNVEAVVVRIWRAPHVGWRLEPSAPPPPALISDKDETEEPVSELAVLRAELEGDSIRGRVLGGFPVGAAQAFQVSVGGVQHIGSAEVRADRSFNMEAAALELEAWKSGRLVLRLEAGDDRAEGFVAFRDLQEVRRRAGKSAARLLAVMAHVDAPEDALAMMSWFQEHPEALTGRDRVGWSGGETEAPPAETYTDPAALLRPHELRPVIATPPSAGSASWQRFINRLIASLGEPRTPFNEPGEDAPDEGTNDDATAQRAARLREKEADRRARWSAKALVLFDHVFERTLAEVQPATDLSGLFALTQYVCNRLSPEPWKVRNYVERLLDGFLVGQAAGAQEEAAAAAMVCAKIDPEQVSAARRARGRLLRLGRVLDGNAPDTRLAAGFLEAMGIATELADIWDAISSERTIPEDIRAYRLALESGQPRPHLPALSKRKEWSVLAAAYDAEPRRRNVRFVEQHAQRCPCSTTALPAGDRHKLASSRITLAPCGHVLLCEAD